MGKASALLLRGCVGCRWAERMIINKSTNGSRNWINMLRNLWLTRTRLKIFLFNFLLVFRFLFMDFVPSTWPSTSLASGRNISCAKGTIPKNLRCKTSPCLFSTQIGWNRSHVREISTRPRKKDVAEFEWNSHRSSFFQWKHFHLLQHSRVPSAEATHFLSLLIIYSVWVSKACQFYEILFLIRGRFNFCECFQKRATKWEWQLVVAERHLTGLHDSLLMPSSSVGVRDLMEFFALSAVVYLTRAKFI